MTYFCGVLVAITSLNRYLGTNIGLKPKGSNTQGVSSNDFTTIIVCFVLAVLCRFFVNRLSDNTENEKGEIRMVLILFFVLIVIELFTKGSAGFTELIFFLKRLVGF